MDGWMYASMDRLIDTYVDLLMMDRYMKSWMHTWVNQMDGWIKDVWMKRWMDE